MHIMLADLIQYTPSLIWTAGHRIGSSKKFKWWVRSPLGGNYTTVRMNYNRWNPGQPDNAYNKNCVGIVPWNQYKWSDASCDLKCWFVCEDRTK